jgi:hypothetical protein
MLGGAPDDATAQTAAEKATYSQQHPGVKGDPWNYYKNFGYKQGHQWPRDGSEYEPPESEQQAYLKMRPDVAKAGMNAWDHYRGWGREEGMKWPKGQSQSQPQAQPTVEPVKVEPVKPAASVKVEPVKPAPKYTPPPKDKPFTFNATQEKIIQHFLTMAGAIYDGQSLGYTRARTISNLEKIGYPPDVMKMLIHLVDAKYATPAGYYTRKEFVGMAEHQLRTNAQLNPSFRDLK